VFEGGAEPEHRAAKTDWRVAVPFRIGPLREACKGRPIALAGHVRQLMAVARLARNRRVDPRVASSGGHPDAPHSTAVVAFGLLPQQGRVRPISHGVAQNTMLAPRMILVVPSINGEARESC
jgi:hypothetical protein